MILGFDAGMGAIKLYAEPGGLEFLSQVAANGGRRVGRMVGLRQAQEPMKVRTEHGLFYVGPGAHEWGRPIENLDYDRLVGAPEMRALLYGALTEYQRRYGSFNEPLTLFVGLPLEPLSGPEAQENARAVRKWLQGTHTWQADGQSLDVEIAEVKITSQPVGALFDYLLDLEGHFIPQRRRAFKREVGIISVGFNTLELLVVRNKKPVQRFTAGTTSGVRRLLELVNHQGLYSLGELDQMLRTGSLDVRDALTVWYREIAGAIERTWGKAWRRFVVVLVVGGGAVLLRDRLLRRFEGKAFIPTEPVLSIARGLYKLGLQQARRRSRGHGEEARATPTS